ncbi:hypothetical protein DL768_002615 [Monosporascus sp. mg162]|nr:hypothetical protein DL768_002615 [Monosporascus sp. mg162]
MDQLGSRKRPILVVDEEYETNKKARKVTEIGANDTSASSDDLPEISLIPLPNPTSANPEPALMRMEHTKVVNKASFETTCTGNPERPAKNFPVQLIFNGSVVKVKDESTNKSVGFLTNTTLCRLVDEFSVTLAATLSVGNPYGGKLIFRQKNDNIRLGTLRVIIYGYRREREAVANFLSHCGVFLQHPQASEYDRKVPYMNPQYLLRPGTGVPSLDHLTIDASPPAEEPLGELQKSKVFQVFECANGAGAKTISRIEPSTRLITALKRHIGPGRIRALVYHGPGRQNAAGNFHEFDVVLASYDTLRSEWATNGLIYAKRWSRIVLDEAHTIRNRSSKIFQAAAAVSAQNRWCLTGTPIQNCLDDFGALLAFIGVPPFSTKDSFDYWIGNAVASNEAYGFQKLKRLVQCTCLRRTKEKYAAALELPRKTEIVELVEMSDTDRELYEFFKRRSYLLADGKRLTQQNEGLSGGNKNILVLINVLRLICNHGEDLLPSAALRAWKNRDPSPIYLETLQHGMRKCSCCGRDIENNNGSEPAGTEFPCQHVICDTCNEIDQSDANVSESMTCPTCGPRRKASKDLGKAARSKYNPSAKVKALMKNLLQDQQSGRPGCSVGQPNKRYRTLHQLLMKLTPSSVIFSYWTKMLDLIQLALKELGLTLYRIDGRSSLPHRREALENFSSDSGSAVLLASIGAVGEGLDLTAANSVHLVEPHWNPMAESQAIDRVHRIGQQRNVVITRYIVRNSIESYVQWIQQDKLKNLVADAP